MTTNDSSQSSSESSDSNNQPNSSSSPTIGPTAEEMRQAFLDLDISELREFVVANVMPSQLANEEMAMVLLTRADKANRQRMILSRKTDPPEEFERLLLLEDFLIFLFYNAVKSFPNIDSLKRLLDKRLEKFKYADYGELDQEVEALLNKLVKKKNSINYGNLQIEVFASAMITPLGTIHYLIVHLLKFPVLVPVVAQLLYDLRPICEGTSGGNLTYGLLLSLIEMQVSSTKKTEHLNTMVQLIKEINRLANKKSTNVLFTFEDLVRILGAGGRYADTLESSKANQIFVINQLIEGNLNGKSKWTKANLVEVSDYLLYCIEVFANSKDLDRYHQAVFVLEQLMERHFPAKLTEEQFEAIVRLCKKAGGNLCYLVLLAPVLEKPFDKYFTADEVIEPIPDFLTAAKATETKITSEP